MISSKTSLSLKPEPSESEVVDLDWDEQFNTLSLNNFYVNWNPAMNKYRRRLHFDLSPENYFADDFIDSTIFNNYRKKQLMVSLSAHSSKNECKFIFERHRQNKTSVHYEIRIRLFGYNLTRMRAATDCYKEARIREDQGFDIISDTMIFEECDDFDNYILVIEAIPQAFLQNLRDDYDYAQPEDPLLSPDSQDYFDRGKLKVKEDLLMSLSLYCWYETEIVPIPFRELAQTKAFVLGQLENMIIKLSVLHQTEFELRVDGFFGFKYAIGITTVLRCFGSDGRPTHFTDSEQFLSRNRIPRAKANILTVQLDAGDYFLHFFESPSIDHSTEDPQDQEYKAVCDKYFFKRAKHCKVQIFAFNQNYSESFAASVERIRNAPESVENLSRILVKSRCLEQMFFEASVIQKFGLSHTQRLVGHWLPAVNKEPVKFDLTGFQNYHRNPGYVVSLDTDSQLVFSVKPKRTKNPKCVYKLCIFEISDNFDSKSVHEPEQFTAQTNYETNVFFLPKNRNGYLVLLVPRFVDYSGEFELTIKADHPLANIMPNSSGICKLPWTKQFVGTVNDYQGGTRKFHSFFLNKHFIFSIDKRPKVDSEDLYLEILSDNPKKNLGALIIPVESEEQLFRKGLEDVSIAKVNKVFLSEFNTLHMKAHPGLYLVVPTTFTPMPKGESLNYTLKVFSSAQFSLKVERDFELQQVIKRELRQNQRVKYKMSIEDQQADVVLVIKGVESGKSELQVIDLVLGKCVCASRLILRF